MLLKEILEDADLLVNNALSQDQKIRYFNQVQRALFRDYPLKEEAYYFVAVPGIALYDLPPDCDEDFVISIYLDGMEYTYQTPNDPASGTVYTFTNGKLFIQPTPNKQVDGYIYYKSKPIDVSLTDLDKEPAFLKDFHQLYVLGLAAKFALIGKDYKTADELEVRFQNLARDAMTKMGRIKLKKTRIVRGWI
jgi:hypothetical protein